MEFEEAGVGRTARTAKDGNRVYSELVFREFRVQLFDADSVGYRAIYTPTDNAVTNGDQLP